MSLKNRLMEDARLIAGSNRRFAPRTDCRLSAKIKQNDVEICACVIKDVSESGMRLLVTPGSWIPYKFEIHAGEFGDPVSVRTEWATADQLGVSFLQPGSTEKLISEVKS